jgi:hypothetical protein
MEPTTDSTLTTHTEPAKAISGWIGHIITLLLAGTAGGVGYGTVESRLATLEARVNTMDSQVVFELRDMKQDLGDLRVNIAEMGQDIRWLKEKSGN